MKFISLLIVLLSITCLSNLHAQSGLIDTSLISTYREKARVFTTKNALDSALYYDKMLISIYHDLNDTVNQAKIYNYAAKLYSKKFEFDSAFSYLNKGLSLFPRGEYDQAEEAELYNTLGSIYYYLDDITNALIYFKYSLDIRLKYNSSRDKIIGDSYTNLGNCYFSLVSYDKAINNYQKALDQRLSADKKNNVMIAKNYNNIGFTLLTKGDVDEARKYCTIAFQYAPLAAIYQNLGEIFEKDRNYYSADTCLQKALKIRYERLGAKHFLTAQSYIDLAGLEFERGNKDQALHYYSEALNSSIKSDENNFIHNNNAKLYDIISVKEFFTSVNGKVSLLISSKETGSDLSGLEYAWKLLSLCIPLINDIQKNYELDKSKLMIREITDQTMNLGVDVCYTLFKLTNNNKYIESAFDFSEAKRNSVLNESRKRKDIMTALGMPDSLIKKEAQLKQKLNLLFITSSDNQNNETDEQQSLNSNSFINVNKEYETLLEQIKNKYPGFDKLLSGSSLVSPLDIKKSCGVNDVIAEYTVTENDLYVFCISQDSVQIIKKEKRKDFEKTVDSYLSGIKKLNKNEYVKAARSLYSYLIKPIEGYIKADANLVIIPCIELSAIPFEAFITEKGTPLIESIKISYCTSSDKLISEKISKNNSYSYYFSGIAPPYKGLAEYASLNNDSEIKDIADVIKKHRLNSLSYINGTGIKANYFKCLENSKILHIAAHTFLDTLHEETSGIVFSSDSIKKKSEILTSSEIMVHEVKNDLVVLSTCEGGKGIAAKGEGVLSIARNFLKAGAKNVIAALWKIPDTQTKLFMTEFYRQLVIDNDYTAALRRAKLSFIKNKQNTFPYTWSSFILVH